MADAALRLKSLFEQLLGTSVPVRIRAWDGSEAGPPEAPTLVVRNRRALRRLLWKPGELGMARAWVSGDLGIEGDLYAALDAMSELVCSARPRFWPRPDSSRRVVPRTPPRSGRSISRQVRIASSR